MIDKAYVIAILCLGPEPCPEAVYVDTAIKTESALCQELAKTLNEYADKSKAAVCVRWPDNDVGIKLEPRQ